MTALTWALCLNMLSSLECHPAVAPAGVTPKCETDPPIHEHFVSATVCLALAWKMHARVKVQYIHCTVFVKTPSNRVNTVKAEQCYWINKLVAKTLRWLSWNMKPSVRCWYLRRPLFNLLALYSKWNIKCVHTTLKTDTSFSPRFWSWKQWNHRDQYKWEVLN